MATMPDGQAGLTAERQSGRRLWRSHTKTLVADGIPVLFVEGRLDHAGSSQLEAAVLKHEPGPEATVIIDVSGVDYLSSAALKVFAALAERQAQQGGRLLLRSPSVAARLALDLAGLDGLVG